MFLANNLANMLKNIFFTDLLVAKKIDLTIDKNLVDEFDNTKEHEIDLVNQQKDFHSGQVDLIKEITVDYTQNNKISQINPGL